MSITMLLIVILLIFCIVGVPRAGGWNHGYGYWPSGVGLVLAILLLWLLLGGRLR